jgi:uncharacterized protein YaeQ
MIRVYGEFYSSVTFFPRHLFPMVIFIPPSPFSYSDEPDLWCHSLDGKLELWIDVGEPAVERIKKATRVAEQVKIYCFNNKASTWGEINRPELEKLNASVFQVQWEDIQALAKLVDRTVDASIMITDGAVYVATEQGECELGVSELGADSK